MITKLKLFIKNSFGYKIWLFFKYPEFLKHLKNEKLFYSRLIKRGSLVFDIGANIGNKTVLFRKLGYKIVSVEPDAYNFKLLVNRIKSSSVVLLNCAVSNKIGESVFYIEEPGSAFNTLSEKWKKTLETPEINRWHSERKFHDNQVVVKTITLDSMINKYGRPFYIKIDVEGFELNVLLGLTESIPIISFEANLPEFTIETLSCINHLFKNYNGVTFNYMVNDEYFELENNISKDEMSAFINNTDRRYLEIFSFMKQ